MGAQTKTPDDKSGGEGNGRVPLQRPIVLQIEGCDFRFAFRKRRLLFDSSCEKINKERGNCRPSLLPVVVRRARRRAPAGNVCGALERFISCLSKHASHASGTRPTCAPPLRCAGPLGCHGHPPLTCRWAPGVRCGAGEGRRLSPRPLRRSSWPLTGSRSQRAPSRTLRDDGSGSSSGDGGQVRGHAERVGAEQRQTHMVPLAQESSGLN